MAMANIGELLYRHGMRVLMVDFDLEAPGLERFFNVPEAVNKPADVLAKPGVLDMLLSYKELRSLPPLNRHQEEEAESPTDENTFPFPVQPLSDFIVPIYQENSEGGTLSLIPAGHRAGDAFTDYAEGVRSLDWHDFYSNWNGERFFEWFRRGTEAIADVVLLDSRTGVTEMSGVCTHQLADVVIMFVAATQQNLDGSLMMARSLTNSQLVQEGRGGRPLHLLFVPSRVEDGEADKLDEFARQFEQILWSYVPDQMKFERGLFVDLKVPYVPYYAFMESVAVREPERASAADMIESFQRLVLAMGQLAPESAPMRQLYKPKTAEELAEEQSLVAEKLFTEFIPEEQ